jgi:ankyrin repeat protein
MTTRMTSQRLGRLIAAGEVEAVRQAVGSSTRLVGRGVERAGQGGWTPLHVAVAEGQADVVRVLVEAGADLAARTEHNRTPLHIALQYSAALVPLLLELGAVIDAPSAAYLDDVPRLTELLDGGAALTDPLSGVDLLSWAALGGADAAAKGGHVDLVRMLLEAGADVDRRDPDSGRAPLHAAVAAGPEGDALEIVRVLLAAGADVNATTSDGASALDISRVGAARHRRDDAGQATGHDALAELLVAHGATG